MSLLEMDIFLLKHWLMKPYPGKNLDSVKELIITGYQEQGEQLKMHLGYWQQSGEYSDGQ